MSRWLMAVCTTTTFILGCFFVGTLKDPPPTKKKDLDILTGFAKTSEQVFDGLQSQ